MEVHHILFFAIKKVQGIKKLFPAVREQHSLLLIYLLLQNKHIHIHVNSHVDVDLKKIPK